MKNKEEKTAEEMKKYSLDILGVSEAHLRRREKVLRSTVMEYSAIVEGRAKGSVAMMFHSFNVCCFIL